MGMPPSLLRLPLRGCNRAHGVLCPCSKTRGMGAGRKLQIHRRNQRWADKDYKKSHLGSEWKKPFAGGARVCAGLVLTPPARQQGAPGLWQGPVQRIVQLLLLLGWHRRRAAWRMCCFCRCFPRQRHCPGEDVSHSSRRMSLVPEQDNSLGSSDSNACHTHSAGRPNTARQRTRQHDSHSHARHNRQHGQSATSSFGPLTGWPQTTCRGVPPYDVCLLAHSSCGACCCLPPSPAVAAAVPLPAAQWH